MGRHRLETDNRIQIGAIMGPLLLHAQYVTRLELGEVLEE